MARNYSQRYCKKCNKPYMPTGPAQVQCEACADIQWRESIDKWQRENPDKTRKHQQDRRDRAGVTPRKGVTCEICRGRGMIKALTGGKTFYGTLEYADKKCDTCHGTGKVRTD